MVKHIAYPSERTDCGWEILYYTGAADPPQDLDPAFETIHWRDHDTLWPKVIRVHLVDELIYPIYPTPIKRDTFTFEVVSREKGRVHWINTHSGLTPIELWPANRPYINVGTIGHVDYSALPRGNWNKFFLQRSKVLHPGHARGAHWFTSL